jgi:heme O synthase-like polyprenyltransferase
MKKDFIKSYRAWGLPLFACLCYILAVKGAFPTYIYCFIAVLVGLYFFPVRAIFGIDESQKTFSRFLFVFCNILFSIVSALSISRAYLIGEDVGKTLINPISIIVLVLDIIMIYYLIKKKPEEKAALLCFCFSFF